jgi:peptide/nickel transport system substrate-binding protein
MTRKKLNEVCFEKSEEKIPLSFSLITVNQPLLIKVAELLKSQWAQLGCEVKIKVFDVSALEREIIKKRNYESLLFGEVLGTNPDPFPFWHSSQKKDPGLNLSLYKNKNCDKLLEKARQNLNKKERKEILEKFQDILIKDAPAVFLYNPDYLYSVKKEIKGIKVQTIIDPSKRFSEIEDWYIKTKRVLAP